MTRNRASSSLVVPTGADLRSSVGIWVPSRSGARQRNSAPSSRVIAAILCLAVAGNPFVYTPILTDRAVSVADLLFGGAVVLTLGSVLFGRRSFRLPPWSAYLWAMTIWMAFGALVAANNAQFPFDGAQFARSYSKFLYYALGAAVIWAGVRELSLETAAAIVFGLVTVNAAASVYIYLGMTAMPWLPYEFLWHGQATPLTAAYYGDAIVRARGLFSEPSALGIFQVMGLAFVLLRAERFAFARPIRLALVLLSIFMTFSLSAYALLMVLTGLLLARRWHARSRTQRGSRSGLGHRGDNAESSPSRRQLPLRVGLALVSGFVLICAGIVFSDTLQSTIVDRLELALKGADSSTTARVVDSWESAIAVAERSPVVGAGLGNAKYANHLLASETGYSFELAEGVDGWNALAYMLGNTGVLGLALFAALLLRLVRMNFPSGIMLVVLAFATGAVLDSYFWVCYMLFTATFSDGARPGMGS